MLLFAQLVYLMFVLSLTEVCSVSKTDSYKRDKRFWFRFDNKETSNQPKKRLRYYFDCSFGNVSKTNCIKDTK